MLYSKSLNSCITSVLNSIKIVMQHYKIIVFILSFFIVGNSSAETIKLGLNHDLYDVFKSKIQHKGEDSKKSSDFSKPKDKIFNQKSNAYGLVIFYELEKNKEIYVSWQRKNIAFHTLQLNAKNIDNYMIPPFNHSGNLYKPAKEVKCNYVRLVDAGEMVVTGEQIRGVRENNYAANLSSSVVNIKTDTLMLGGKLVLDKEIFFTHPFLKFGIGMSLNRIKSKKHSSYIKENKDDEVRRNQERKQFTPKLNLNSDIKNQLEYQIEEKQKKKINMSIELGVGVDIKLNKKITLDISATYYNYGKNSIFQNMHFQNKGVVLKSGINIKI
jgi:opacity protein-like surface antigen